jgi:hypothetical protein
MYKLKRILRIIKMECWHAMNRKIDLSMLWMILIAERREYVSKILIGETSGILIGSLSFSARFMFHPSFFESPGFLVM